MAEITFQSIDRRPIKSRSWPVWIAVANFLARRGISANAVSVASIFFAIIAATALAATSFLHADIARLTFVLAAFGIQLRLLANMLDGMIALATGTSSPVGELYNEVPDRISDTAILVGAGYALGGEPALGYLAACAALFTAYVRAMGKASGAPQDFCGPMAKPQRMFLLTLVCLYFGLSPVAWQPTWNGWGLCAAGLLAIIAGSAITAFRRLAHISRYLWRASS